MSHGALALTCVLAPLVGFAVAILGLRRRHAEAAAVVIVTGLVSLVAAVWLLAGAAPGAQAFTARWFAIGEMAIDFGLLLDGRTLIMGAVVALITLCVEVYSVFYMAHDRGRGRFFAFLAFFEWSMLSFVYAASLLQMFVFWELVGLASFLLIGFWYEKPSAVAAAKKAFLMTRIGDLGFFIGLILLFRAAGTLDVLGIVRLFEPEGLPASIAPGRIELIATLLFIGVIGKSAQFPLHTWLPDAMEGPTPVSALLHSATMVAAGVFLVTRFHGLFLDAPSTMNLILWIATFTALLSSTMAMVAKDMKRVLAFSSISQLGFMLIGLGAGSLAAGYFHLTTHAFFKALLFLCAGAYIHAAGSNDLVAIGRSGAARKMTVTSVGLVAGAGALAGLPPLAGFFSKELILSSLHGPGMLLFRIGAMAAAFMTAYYTFRMVFLVLRPNTGSGAQPDEPANPDHAHGPLETLPMRLPILVLTIGALVAGFFGDRIAAVLGVEELHHPGIGEMAPAVIVALLGVGLAWWDFGRAASPQTGFLSRAPAIHRLFERRWYLDELYRVVFVGPAIAIARLCFSAETRGLDAGLDALAYGTAGAGRDVARSHAGRVQVYIGVALVVAAALVVYVGVR